MGPTKGLNHAGPAGAAGPRAGRPGSATRPAPGRPPRGRPGAGVGRGKEAMVARSKAGAWRSNVPAARARRSRGAVAGTRGRRAALALLAAVGMAWGPPALTAAPPDPGL